MSTQKTLMWTSLKNAMLGRESWGAPPLPRDREFWGFRAVSEIDNASRRHLGPVANGKTNPHGESTAVSMLILNVHSVAMIYKGK